MAEFFAPYLIVVQYHQGEKDDKIIAVCADDPEFRHYKDISDLPPHRLQEIRRFFEDCMFLNLYPQLVRVLHYRASNAVTRVQNRYISAMLTDKKNENKEVAVNDFLPAEDAIKAIEHSM
jgi:inorganic pyrophosphatase